MADPSGAPGRRTPGPNSFIFMQFSTKYLQNNRFVQNPGELAPPPLGNPGSAAEVCWFEKVG